jgi:RNA methyltransferase, TrmH family
VLARVAGTVTPQPVIAVVETPLFELMGLKAMSPQLVVVCVDVRDPGNAGTVARSAWAAGADAVVCCEGTVDLWNPKAVRSSAGAVFHMPIVAAGPAAEVLAEIGGLGLRRLATVSEGGVDYAAEDLTSRVAFVFGNEAAGLPLGELRTQLDGLVSIPMARGAESLNVGMAAAVLCFEVARQRRFGAPASSGQFMALRLGGAAAE